MVSTVRISLKKYMRVRSLKKIKETPKPQSIGLMKLDNTNKDQNSN
tara:strand:+ start:309 stop:446 length:138 start_codon:yes stop_codon:yes gene_type:complete